MEAPETPPSATAKRLWQITRAVFVMLRQSIAKRLLFSDLRLELLFYQGKLAGKSLRSVLSDLSHYHHTSAHGGAVSALSCRYMDPDAVIYTPREVEFSCSNTPCYAAPRRRSHHGGYRGRRHGRYNAAAVTRAFEILDSVTDDSDGVHAQPTPMMHVLLTPTASVRKLRVTDSPFLTDEDEADVVDEMVDREAEEFIQEFYEQLRRQKMRAY